MKDYLGAVRRLPPSKQEAVLDGLDELVERIENANNLEWLPIGTNLQLTEAVFVKLGDEQAEQFYQNWLKRQMSAPAFAGLVRTALALFRFDTLTEVALQHPAYTSLGLPSAGSMNTAGSALHAGSSR